MLARMGIEVEIPNIPIAQKGKVEIHQWYSAHKLFFRKDNNFICIYILDFI
jgi:hypothetical protein